MRETCTPQYMQKKVACPSLFLVAVRCRQRILHAVMMSLCRICLCPCLCCHLRCVLFVDVSWEDQEEKLCLTWLRPFETHAEQFALMVS